MKDIGLGAALMLITIAAAGCHDQDAPTSTEPTAPESPASLATAAAPLSFFQMTTGLNSCGITDDSRLYCWGSQGVGDGTNSTRLSPVAIASSLRFKLVSAKNTHTCAITTDSRLYCWGNNASGQLGDGTTTTRLTPHQVSGNRAYRQVDVGRDHTCAVAAADDRAYCWGLNTDGQLGIEVHDARKLTPTLVAGGRQYKQVQAGLRHSCAVTTSNVAFCWGLNRFGAVGDSSTAARRWAPVRVAGSHQFVQIDAGLDYSCAVTTTNRAFCWGYGRDGQIGDGKTSNRFWPRAVAGGLTFRRVSTGHSHVCGETPSDKVYCWGDNPFGGIGDGTTGQDRPGPTAVVGGLSFSQVAAGLYSTCGRTTSGVGYCWGFNGYGQVGDGTETSRPAPVKVAPPEG